MIVIIRNANIFYLVQRYLRCMQSIYHPFYQYLLSGADLFVSGYDSGTPKDPYGPLRTLKYL
jgi:hypothetical protein